MITTKKSREEIERIVQEYRSGIPIGELAESYGVHRVTITKYLSEAGVVPNPGKTSYQQAVRKPTKAVDLEPAYEYLRDLGDPRKTKVMHDLVEQYGRGYKYSSRGLFRQKINEWLDSLDGRFSQMARAIALDIADGEAIDNYIRAYAIRILSEWLYSYSTELPPRIEDAALSLNIQADILTIKKWILKKDEN
jgi:hypothetical protein